MANTDIRLLLSFRNHHKTKKLRFKLGNDAVLSFIWLMMFAAESKPDGVLSGMDAEDIALAADWQGEATEFVDVLVAVRYLDFDGHTYSIHDWEDNNPWAAGAPERSEKARHAANVRHGKDKKPATKNQTLTPKKPATSTNERCAEHETALQDCESGNAPSPSPSPSPSPIPNPKNGAGALGDIPDWIDPSIWQEFEQHRREIRAKLTPTATARLIANLDKHRSLGADPNEALRQSIENQWRGVFPERLLEKPNARSRSGQAAVRENNDERRAREADEYRQRILAN